MIEVKDLALKAGAFHLERVDFHVPPGAYAILMGKTGCGKTSLLEAVCGFAARSTPGLTGVGAGLLKIWEEHFSIDTQEYCRFSGRTGIGNAESLRQRPSEVRRIKKVTIV